MATRYHVERHIEADQEKVWGLLTDATTWADWNPTVVSIEGPISQGQVVKLVSTLNPKRTFKLKVDQMTAPSHMVWSDGMPLGLFKGERTYRVNSSGEGSEFTMTEEYTGLLAPLITKSIPDMTESFEQFADGLKQGAEGS